MNQLRLYFKSQDFSEYDWCLSSEEGIKAGNESSGVLAELSANCADIVFVLPQQWVYLTSIETTQQQNKQLIQAVAYQLEDQFAEDVDELHFASGKESNNTIPFVVIKKSIMNDLIQFEKQAKITATCVVVESDCMPAAEPNELLLLTREQHCVLKSQQYELVSVCQAHQLDAYCDLYKKKNPQLSIKHFDGDLLNTLVDAKSVINLKQKEFSNSDQWRATMQRYYWPLGILILIFCLQVFNLWSNNKNQQTQLDQIVNEQESLLKQQGLELKGSAKKTLIKVLQSQNGQLNQTDFIATFHRLLLAKAEISSLKLDKISYQNQKLTVDITATNFQDLDRLSLALKQQGFKVNVDQMNADDNLSQGRFILEAL